MGYYGGAGARLMTVLGPFAGKAQPDPPIGPNRLRECQWEPAVELKIPADWLSGVYLGRLTRIPENANTHAWQSFIVFVFRDRRRADVLFQVSDNTWQAYNRWPDRLLHVYRPAPPLGARRRCQLRSPLRQIPSDLRTSAIGRILAIPYGIYDLLANRGSVMVGVSHDTSAFAAHAIAHWWRQEGSTRYPRSRQLLILSDTGGSNGARRRTWKTELQSQLADSLGLTLTVAHYPTGASKWNPIEHRLFSEISKNWAGEPLDSYQKILNFIRSTRTETGLAVTAHLDRRNYPTGTEPTPEQLQSLRLKPHVVLPKWNYTISPNL